ncbi:MAG: hypothetical protein M1819_000600 [Sarea resinae]|nr:MAG: hypothetical protein M1819_000600 [Sarea resinae]
MADADPLYEILLPHLPSPPSATDPTTTSTYLTRLSTLSLASLTSSEPQSLSQSSHTYALSLQSLSTRSFKAVIDSDDHLSTLRTSLPQLATATSKLHHDISCLDDEGLRFSKAYGKSAENPLLDRRKKAMLLARNVDRLSDILELPTLLSSAISSSSSSNNNNVPSSTTNASATANYASALELHAHIKRLHTLYPSSALINTVSLQSEDAMRGMATNLIASLRTQGVKLAGGMRTIGWLRRVAPELDDASVRHLQKKGLTTGGHEGSLGALFLVCRLANLVAMLEALEPLRELADQECERRAQVTKRQSKESPATTDWSGGQQTERYLKRYIEIFREQSFAIIAMYKSIFPASSLGQGAAAAASSDEPKPKANGKLQSSPSPSLPSKTGHHPPSTTKPPSATKPSSPSPPSENEQGEQPDPLQPLPPALATFPLHLVDLLAATLRKYLPNVRDRTARDSLLTQVLYAAGSLGRLGGDFSMVLSELEDTGSGDEGAEEEEDVDEDEDEDEDEEEEEEEEEDKDKDGGPNKNSHGGVSNLNTEEREHEEEDEVEWIDALRKHRMLAGRLELLASGGGASSTIQPHRETSPVI